MQLTRRNMAYGVLAVFALALMQHNIKYQLLGTTLGRAATILLIAVLTLQDKLLGFGAVCLVALVGSSNWLQEGMKKKKKKKKSSSTAQTKAEKEARQDLIEQLVEELKKSVD